MNGKTSGLYCAIAKFTDERDIPLQGNGWTVSLSDQDAILDDHLGLVSLDGKGNATFLLSVADIKSIDSWGERNPDLYFTLFRDGKEIFRSDVVDDVDFEALDPVSGEPDQITQNFGPYRVDTRA